MSTELERLAAACIFPSFPGYEAPAWVLGRIEAGVGGICLFAYNVRDRGQLASLTSSLRAARPDLLIGIDEEGGDVTRLEVDHGSSYPGNGALGAVDDEELTGRVAAAIGADLAAVGVNLDFAPVADVNVNPANPVIGIRSFGADADLVARHVAAFVTGLQSQGVAACAKHFPGHGTTEQDSHLELPVVIGDFRDGLPPFRAAIAAGVRSIMTAHVRVPDLDAAPATVSRAVVQGLLREELGYKGLVVADALEMKGLSETIGIERGAVLALAAGVDTLLVGHDLGEDSVAAVQAALVGAVGSGELGEDRLREAAARVAETGDWARRAAVDGMRGAGSGREAAVRALEPEGHVALDGDVPFVVELRPRANSAVDEAEHSLGAILGRRVPGTEELVLEGDSPDVGRALGLRGGRKLVIVVRDAHRFEWMREATDSLVSSVSDSIVVEVGLPVWRPRSQGYVATLGGSRVSYEALAGLLAGGADGDGSGCMTRLELELREQPEALARLLETQGAHAERLGALFRRDDVKYLLIASRGSSSNAARYAQYLLGRASRVPVAFATPSLYTLYEQPPRLEGALVIGISQSGESPDVRAVIEQARLQGRPSIAITNRAESPIGLAAEAVLPLEAGDELAVAATKTYLNSLAAIALLFAASTRDAEALRELKLMPARIAAQLKRSFGDIAALGEYEGIRGGTVVARGINYGTSFEIALKIRELSGLLFEAWSSADLMHGPVAAIGAGWPVIAVAPSGPALASMQTAIDGLAERGARVIVIADRDDVLARGVAPMRLVPGVPEWLSPLTAVIPGQLAAMRLARLNGKDLDSPEGLSKITLTL